MDVAAGRAPARATRALAVVAIGAVGAAVVLIAALHVVPPSADLDPTRRTISHYALLANGWVFDLALWVLSAGSVAALGALVGARLVPAASGASAALLLWSASLVAVVFFPKHNWSVGPSAHGDIHRVAGVVAFVSLPVAALLAARVWAGSPRWRGHALWAGGLAVLSLLAFLPIVVAVATQPITGVSWWRAIPLGTVERVLAGCEVATVLALAWWAGRASVGRAVEARRVLTEDGKAEEEAMPVLHMPAATAGARSELASPAATASRQRSQPKRQGPPQPRQSY